MTRVLVDAAALSDSSKGRGIGAYTRHVLDGLAADERLEVLALAVESASLPKGIEVVPTKVRVPRRALEIERAAAMTLAVRRVKPDVVFNPGLPPPWAPGVPWVQTLHDIIPLTFPDPVFASDRRRWRRRARPLRRAAAVVAVSRYSAEQAIEHLGLDRERVHVVPNGCDMVFTPRPLPHPQPQPGRVASPYLLYVGSWGPHKGYSEAAQVVAQLADAGFPHRLLIAGPQDEWMTRQARAQIAAAPRPELVELLGYVDDLVALYQGADAVVVSSRAEGFGLPALEGMASGAPVVAFDNTSLPEVVGDGGVLVPDGDTAAMADALVNLLRDHLLRSEIVARGLRRASSFEWSECAHAVADIIANSAAR